MAQKEKSAPDWERIEADYRAGVLSVREVAASQGISHAAVGKRAKRDGWERTPKPGKTKVYLSPEDEDEFDTSGFIYVLLIDSGLEKFYKVGMAKNFGIRFAAHQCASPFPIQVVCCYFTGNMRAEERALHAEYSAKRVRGEWFRLEHSDLQRIAQRSLILAYD